MEINNSTYAQRQVSNHSDENPTITYNGVNRNEWEMSFCRIKNDTSNNWRGKTLLDAFSVINGQRQDAYGNPEDSHQKIADYWTAYMGSRLQGKLNAMDVALMMVLLKIARTQGGKRHEDNFVDMAAYAALANDINKAATEGAHNAG